MLSDSNKSVEVAVESLGISFTIFAPIVIKQSLPILIKSLNATLTPINERSPITTCPDIVIPYGLYMLCTH